MAPKVKWPWHREKVISSFPSPMTVINWLDSGPAQTDQRYSQLDINVALARELTAMRKAMKNARIKGRY